MIRLLTLGRLHIIGSNNGNSWDDLCSFDNIILNTRLKVFHITPISPIPYDLFRLFFIETTEYRPGPGLSYWQLYSLDPIM